MPSDPGRRALAAIACASLFIAAAYRGLPAWHGWRSAAVDRAILAEETLRKERVRLDRLPELLDTAEARVARVKLLGPSLIVSDSAAAAADDLVNTIVEIAHRHSVQIDSISADLDTMQIGNVLTAIASVHVVTDIQGLAHLLAAIERPPAMMGVTRMSVRPLDVDVLDTHPEAISAAVTVEAVALVRARNRHLQ